MCIRDRAKEERDEIEKDIWTLENLDIAYKKNPIKNVQTLNFTAIIQDDLREETKKAVYEHLHVSLIHISANYLVSQQVQQMQEEEKNNEGKVSTEYVAPKQDVQSISVAVTPEMYLLDGVSVLVLNCILLFHSFPIIHLWVLRIILFPHV